MLATAEAISADRPEKRIKDRAATEKAIFNAARSLLAEEGFQGLASMRLPVAPVATSS